MGGSVLDGYDPNSFYCEMLHGVANQAIRDRLGSLTVEALKRRAANAEAELYNLGITFTVYSENEAIDRILPFDVIPRVLSAAEWRRIESGVVQRVTALNLLLHDIYHEQRIIADGIIPADLILGNANYRSVMRGVDLPCSTYVHISGTDIVRDETGELLVLEDNARTPSGVGYVIENRRMMQRAFSDLLNEIGLRPVDNYGMRLISALSEVAPAGISAPQIVLLSPGTYNSAYFEHVFLAREMGVPLVEGRDLTVENDRVYMRTTGGRARVDVVYRRINDDFLDPEVFRPDSSLGVRGLVRACRAGNVTLANAIGTGVADDKAIYAYMPRVIRYYLGAEAILPNVETHICREPAALRYTLDHLAELVVKPVGEAGGYGITVGPRASRAELEECRAKLIADPANYISQPCIALSVSPTLVDGRIEPRHVDLRPFSITGATTWVLPGGLTRVALREGSLVVNSSQGGGSKDTWSLSDVLLSRYAESIFWLARYVERAENLARILDVNETFSRDSQGSQNWLSIIELNADEKHFFARHDTPSARNVLGFYLTDAENPTSIVSIIRAARENARTLRPLISTEMWVQLNIFHNRVQEIGADDFRPGRLSQLFGEIKEACQTHAGITDGTFYRDQGWYFYQLGRYIERADQTTRLLDMKYHLLLPKVTDVGSPIDVSQWNALLRSVAGYHAYRRTHIGITPARVVGFLLLDMRFPRSVHLCVAEAGNLLIEMKSRHALRNGNDAAEELDRLRGVLGTLTVADVMTEGLHEFLDLLQRQFIAISAELTHAFFGGEPRVAAPSPLRTQ